MGGKWHFWPDEEHLERETGEAINRMGKFPVENQPSFRIALTWGKEMGANKFTCGFLEVSYKLADKYSYSSLVMAGSLLYSAGFYKTNASKQIKPLYPTHFP